MFLVFFVNLIQLKKFEMFCWNSCSTYFGKDQIPNFSQQNPKSRTYLESS